MNKKTLKALKGSIKKWEKIVAGKGVDRKASNCPLCTLTIAKIENHTNCEICPIFEKIDYMGCEGTPYKDWINYMVNTGQRFPYKAITDFEKALAQAELDFLKSLLPKEN